MIIEDGHIRVAVVRELVEATLYPVESASTDDPFLSRFVEDKSDW
jgi:hypothetical protein